MDCTAGDEGEVGVPGLVCEGCEACNKARFVV